MNNIRKDIYLSPVNKELLKASVEDGWFDCSESNWKLGYGRGVSGAIAFRNQFLRDLDRDDKDVKVIGIYKNLTPIGYATVSPKSDLHKVVDLDIFLAKDFRGKTFAPTILDKLLSSIFKAGAYRVEVETLKINREAVKWLRHSGFTQEAIRRSSHWMENNVFDRVVLRLLRSEYVRKFSEV